MINKITLAEAIEYLCQRMTEENLFREAEVWLQVAPGDTNPLITKLQYCEELYFEKIHYNKTKGTTISSKDYYLSRDDLLCKSTQKRKINEYIEYMKSPKYESDNLKKMQGSALSEFDKECAEKLELEKKARIKNIQDSISDEVAIQELLDILSKYCTKLYEGIGETKENRLDKNHCVNNHLRTVLAMIRDNVLPLYSYPISGSSVKPVKVEGFTESLRDPIGPQYFFSKDCKDICFQEKESIAYKNVFVYKDDLLKAIEYYL